ncbi:dephospho-CoA kinase [Kiritimatiellaeota bacterium B1221]|nr:dephospho-CoA kinase [Kiritimatiellaeota bacterium B1221]
MTKRIGLTGGIACGKSVVADRLMTHNIPVLDTDQVAHELLKPGNPVFDAIVKRFGADMVDAQSGEINRSLLGHKVFGDDAERRALNALMHPEIGKRWRNWLQAQNAEMAVVAIPLLFEVGVEKDFDGILCVWSPEPVMIERMKKRNLTENEAALRIRAQLPVDLKAEKSTWTLKNNATLENLYTQVDDWVKQCTPQEN